MAYETGKNVGKSGKKKSKFRKIHDILRSIFLKYFFSAGLKHIIISMIIILYFFAMLSGN